VVELLGGTLDKLSGTASWPEWSERLRSVYEEWLGPERDREAEEHRPPPPGEVGAAPPAQAPEAPRKAHDGHPGSREHRRVEAPARVRYETAQRTPR